MNHASIISRINKAIKKIETSATTIGIHFVTIDNTVDDLQGLVIILHPESQATPKSPV